MHRPKYKIDKVISFHSFDWYQVSVVSIKDAAGQSLKGVAVYPVPTNLSNHEAFVWHNDIPGVPLALDLRQSLQLSQYVTDVLAGRLPKSFETITDGIKIRLKLKKFIEKWPGGGGYKGNMGLINNGFLNLLPKVTVSKKTLIDFQASLVQFYSSNNIAAPSNGT